jgi:hypothetical protein
MVLGYQPSPDLADRAVARCATKINK